MLQLVRKHELTPLAATLLTTHLAQAYVTVIVTARATISNEP